MSWNIDRRLRITLNFNEMRTKILIGFLCILFCGCQEYSDLKNDLWYQIVKADFEGESGFSCAYTNHVGAYNSDWGLLCRSIENMILKS